jgi:hypothetical protein
MAKISQKISRKDASKLLKVSMRTVDRYVKCGKLSMSTVGSHVFLDRLELLELKKSRQVVDTYRHDLSIDKLVDRVDKEEPEKEELVYSVSTRKAQPQSKNSKIYEKLFSELRTELHERQERLEIANYRVGQLETQLRNSIAIHDYHREKFLRDKDETELKNKIQESDSIIRRMVYKLKYEKLIKKMYLLLMLIIIALQPLWLLVIYK